MREPVTVAFGAGVDSTAMLIELVRRKEPVDLILFADTGGELEQIYNHVRTFSYWLKNNDYPGVTVVYPRNRKGEIIKLEDTCLRLGTLPSLAFGWHTCSHRFKIGPQEKFINHWAPAKKAWQAGLRVVKLIGFDCGEGKRTFRFPSNPKFRPRFPLQEWGWDRKKCLEVIEETGLISPGKSACFFCPARTKPEIDDLRRENPELIARALEMEENAFRSGKLKKVKGLGRRFSWTEYLKKG